MNLDCKFCLIEEKVSLFSKIKFTKIICTNAQKRIRDLTSSMDDCVQDCIYKEAKGV